MIDILFVLPVVHAVRQTVLQMSFTHRQRTPMLFSATGTALGSPQTNHSNTTQRDITSTTSVQQLLNVVSSPPLPKIITSPESNQTMYATTTFSPATVPPNHLFGTDERSLLQNLSEEIDNECQQLLCSSPSFLHQKKPIFEAKKLKHRWEMVLEKKLNSAKTEVARARAEHSAHLLLLRTLGKTCKIKVYEKLLTRIEIFFNRVFCEVYIGALRETKQSDLSLRAMRHHQERQHLIIMRHVEKTTRAKNKKTLRENFTCWHGETVGRKKKIHSLQIIFHRSSRKSVLQNTFRQWYAAYKGWLKARKQANANLGYLESRQTAEQRVMECQNEIYKLQMKIVNLEKANEKILATDQRRIIQLRGAQQQTASLLELVDSVVYETKEEVEASQHRPLAMRLEYVKKVVSTGGIRRVPKSICMSSNTDPVTITRGKKQRARPATRNGSTGESEHRTRPRSRSVEMARSLSMQPAVTRRNVPRFVCELRKDVVVITRAGHVLWS